EVTQVVRFNFLLGRSSTLMELRLTLSVCGGDTLPVNYQYPISSWIYRVISEADAGYGDFLHQGGFQQGSRHFKMFTFSQLDARPYRVFGNRMRLLGKEVSLTRPAS